MGDPAHQGVGFVTFRGPSSQPPQEYATAPQNNQRYQVYGGSHVNQPQSQLRPVSQQSLSFGGAKQQPVGPALASVAALGASGGAQGRPLVKISQGGTLVETPFGKCPNDLVEYLGKGKPLRIIHGSPATDEDDDDPREADCFVGRFQNTASLSNLPKPLHIERDLTQLITEENASQEAEEAQPPSEGKPSKFRRAPRKAPDIFKMPLKVTDAAHKSYLGRREILDTHTYFAVIDKGDCYDLVPVSAWYTFQSMKIASGGSGLQGGSLSSDLAEKKRRAALKREEQALAELQRRVKKEEEDDFDVKATDDIGDRVYAEDLGLQKLKTKKMKKIIKARKASKKREDEHHGYSALHIGHLKRAEVDWDWDDDGKATDDEDGAGDEENDEEKDLPPVDVAESSDDEEENLTNYGQRVNQALEAVRETEADDELAQFDDEGDEEGKQQAQSADGQPGSSDKKDTAGGVSDAQAQAASGEALKQRVIRTLTLQGGRIPIRQFMTTFNLTERNEHFKAVQAALHEVCEVHEEVSESGGATAPVKWLELKSQFRQI